MIKNGDIVSRKSHNNDILFHVEDVNYEKNIVKLKGVVVRIEADSSIDDLVMADETRINDAESVVERIINLNIKSKSNKY